ncbi:hypothetical protein DFH29DRAFT_995729 [Suillus ampliporus]|nr:hypothetical protein DFH29DRAFT_995729 [Suillus ampliporus]
MTHEQSDFLKSKVDGFCLSQLQGEVAAYCTNTYREWFEKWPEIAEHFKDDAGIMLTESQLTNEQMKQLGVYTKQRHSQIRSYLYCASTASGRAHVTQFTKTITKIMGTTTNCTRGPSAVKHFIQTEYKANPEVNTEIVTQMKNNSDKPHISVLHSEAAKSMAAHGEEFVHHMEMGAKIECARHADQVKADLEAICTPTEALKMQCLEGLGGVVGQLLDAIHEMTGWHGSVYLGGPDPRVNGEVRVFSFHHGKGFSGFNFCETLPDHHGRIVEPFTALFERHIHATAVDASHPSTNSSMTPPAGESLVNVTLGSDSPDITVVNTSHLLTNSGMTPPAGDSVLQGLSCDGMLLDGIHHTPSVPLLNPSLSLEHLLSLDPESLDFLQVDLDSFNLPRFPSLSPSPVSQGLPILPAAPANDQDSPISSWNRDAALGLISPPHLCRIESKSLEKPRPPHPRPVTKGMRITSIYDQFNLCPVSTSVAPSVSAEAPGASHLPATLINPEPLTPAVTSMDTAPLTSAITSADAAPLTPAITSADAAPLMSVVTSADAAPVIPHLESSSDHLVPPMHIPLPAAVGTPAQMDIDDIMEPLDDIVNQPWHHSTRSHVPSTCLDEANRIGSDVHVSKKGRNSRARKSVT